ncbi:NAD(P)-binding protein [Thozetella sp. PMI_491]|nr:NAD(P)-binding protein [Thozetella sp. PMI_491]
MDAKKIVFVTGANTGLGFQIIRALASSSVPYEILVGGRSMDKASKAVEEVMAEFPSTQSSIRPMQIDIEDDNSIEAAFGEVKTLFGKLDTLINNAGTYFHNHAANADGKMTMRQVWTQSWIVNTVGTQIMTNTFVPLLLKSEDPRILFITSGTSTLAGTEIRNIPINEIPDKGWPKPKKNMGIAAYRSSKAGMNMMMREWHRILNADGVKVWCISPGYLATGLGDGAETNRNQGAIDPSIGGQLVKDVVEGMRDADVGQVVTKGGIQPW